jgi:hypothetical protein
MFPMNKSRVDVLDESEKAFTFTVKPMSEAERRASDEEDDRRDHRQYANAVGY